MRSRTDSCQARKSVGSEPPYGRKVNKSIEEEVLGNSSFETIRCRWRVFNGVMSGKGGASRRDSQSRENRRRITRGLESGYPGFLVVPHRWRVRRSRGTFPSKRTCIESGPVGVRRCETGRKVSIDVKRQEFHGVNKRGQRNQGK